MQPCEAGGLEGRAVGRRDVVRLERRVEGGVVSGPVAAPDSFALETRRRQGHASALLEASVDLGREEVGRRDLQLAAVERPPAERVDDVLATELEAQPAAEEAAALDVAVHEVDRAALEPRHDPTRVARVGLGAASSVIGVVTHARTEREARAGRVFRLVVEIVDAHAERGREAAPGDGRLARRATHIVELGRGIARDLRLQGLSRAGREGDERAETDRAEDSGERRPGVSAGGNHSGASSTAAGGEASRKAAPGVNGHGRALSKAPGWGPQAQAAAWRKDNRLAG